MAMVTWVGGAVESPAAGWSELADVLDRALTFPPDHHLRWQVLKELDRFGTGTVVAEAVALARSGDPQRAVLGVEMLSTVPPRRDFVAAQWPTVAAVLDLLI